MAMKEAGNELISIVGARSKDLLIMEERMGTLADEIIVCTDDGSYGFHGFVSDALKNILDRGKKVDLCVAIGPAPMMKAVANLTKEYDLPTVVSLNTIMVDGTGMCGACRVTVGGVTKFVCVDGPEFDGHKVDWDEMGMRMRAYLPQEKDSLDRFHELVKTERHVETCNYGG
jgi:ferredoxin--NADP+ reductase